MKDNISIVSNVLIRQMELEGVGDFVQGHSHNFDHQHLLVAGTVLISVDDKEVEYTAPHIIFIAKGKEHKMVTVSDYALGYCIHPIRTGYRVEDIADPVDLPNTIIDPLGDAKNFIETHGRAYNVSDEK
jgi:quercetin dioxygenase-like cupin family protein